jgi:stearoyl-CoA desaturase (delta-9 desaturase)
MFNLTRNFPPNKGFRWFNIAVLTVTPMVAIYGLIFVRVRRETVLFSMAYYLFSMLGEQSRYLWDLQRIDLQT